MAAPLWDGDFDEAAEGGDEEGDEAGVAGELGLDGAGMEAEDTDAGGREATTQFAGEEDVAEFTLAVDPQRSERTTHVGLRERLRVGEIRGAPEGRVAVSHRRDHHYSRRLRRLQYW